MSHKFRMVSPNLDRSKKWWDLSDDSCRLTYDWLLWCRHSSPIGIFPLPPAFIVAGLRCSFDEAEARIKELERVGLIETDEDDLLRIVGWFKSAGGANAPSTFTRHCKMFKDRTAIRDSRMRSNALFEMLFYNFQNSENWRQSGEQFVQAMETASKLIRSEVQRQPALSAHSIISQGFDRIDAINGSNWGVAYGTIQTILPPSGGPSPHLGGDIESESESEKESENDITRPPDQPPKKTTQKTIEELNARAQAE